MDYSELTPAIAISNFTFRVTPGGLPNLGINNVTLNPAKTQLTFLLSDGVGGLTYDIEVTVMLTTGEKRSDNLTINVAGDGGCGCGALLAPPPTTGDVSGDGSIIVNTAPRFFVSSTIPVGANVLDRWYDTTNQQVYDYISTGLTTLWQAASSGGGGSGGSGSNVTILSMNPIHPDGVTTVFTLTTVIGRPVSGLVANTLFVSLDGVLQDASTQYSTVNNQIQFAQPPDADSIIFMLWFAPVSP